MASQYEGQTSQRPPSIRSVASTSSVASSCSLTRRARTRARSRTVTGGSSPQIPSSSNDHAPELTYPEKNDMQDLPPSILPNSEEALLRPPRLTVEVVQVQDEDIGKRDDSSITTSYVSAESKSSSVLAKVCIFSRRGGLPLSFLYSQVTLLVSRFYQLHPNLNHPRLHSPVIPL